MARLEWFCIWCVFTLIRAVERGFYLACFVGGAILAAGCFVVAALGICVLVDELLSRLLP